MGNEQFFKCKNWPIEGYKILALSSLTRQRPPGIIGEWKVGGTVGSVKYIFTQNLW